MDDLLKCLQQKEKEGKSSNPPMWASLFDEVDMVMKSKKKREDEVQSKWKAAEEIKTSDWQTQQQQRDTKSVEEFEKESKRIADEVIGDVEGVLKLAKEASKIKSEVEHAERLQKDELERSKKEHDNKMGKDLKIYSDHLIKSQQAWNDLVNTSRVENQQWRSKSSVNLIPPSFLLLSLSSHLLLPQVDVSRDSTGSTLIEGSGTSDGFLDTTARHSFPGMTSSPSKNREF